MDNPSVDALGIGDVKLLFRYWHFFSTLIQSVPKDCGRRRLLVPFRKQLVFAYFVCVENAEHELFEDRPREFGRIAFSGATLEFVRAGLECRTMRDWPGYGENAAFCH